MTSSRKSSQPDLSHLVTLRQLLEVRPFLTERWVRSLVAHGDLPHYKLSNRLLFDPADVDKHIQPIAGSEEIP